MDQTLLKSNLSLIEYPRCKQIVDSKILDNPSSIFAESAFIELLIRLNDILQKLKTNGRGIHWSDDIQAGLDVADVTDLVNKLRNAACHISSYERLVDKEDPDESNVWSVFNFIIGKGNLIDVNDRTALCAEYGDDIAFFYGSKRIYLNRHIRRLLNELPDIIERIPGPIPDIAR